MSNRYAQIKKLALANNIKTFAVGPDEDNGTKVIFTRTGVKNEAVNDMIDSFIQDVSIVAGVVDAAVVERTKSSVTIDITYSEAVADVEEITPLPEEEPWTRRPLAETETHMVSIEEAALANLDEKVTIALLDDTLSALLNDEFTAAHADRLTGLCEALEPWALEKFPLQVSPVTMGEYWEQRDWKRTLAGAVAGLTHTQEFFNGNTEVVFVGKAINVLAAERLFTALRRDSQNRYRVAADGARDKGMDGMTWKKNWLNAHAAELVAIARDATRGMSDFVRPMREECVGQLTSRGFKIRKNGSDIYRK